MADVHPHLRLKKPCANCPFRKEGAIELQPGRLEGIIAGLEEDDHSTFLCHKTVHHESGGEWNESGDYEASGNEAMCAGAAIYLMKIGRPTVTMRVALITKEVDRHYWQAAEAITIEPPPP
jgi:hypothetical protein